MISLKKIYQFESYVSGEASQNSFEGFSIDTRQYQAGDLFVAITGENYNAFEFIESIIGSGCTDIVLTANDINRKLKTKYLDLYPAVSFIEVSDSIKFLQDLARDHRERLSREGNNLKIVSISGSNGKTTCKEMLKHLCSDYEVVATQKNDNNHLGVPLTLLRMNEMTQYGIIELGSNHPGEIPLLCEVTQPDYAYATNIGYTHMEFFPTLDDVFQEESFPLFHCDIAFINKDDQFLSTIDNKKAISIGESTKSFLCDHSSLNINNSIIKNKSLVGKHNYHNLGAMIEIALKLQGQGSFKKIIQLAESFQPGLMRSEWREKNKKQIFLDAYNANPSSMLLAVEAFVFHLDNQNIDHSNAILIIGDMMELGSEARNLHSKTAADISCLGQIKAIFIGQYADAYLEGWPVEATNYPTVEEFMKNSSKHFDGISHIFLKASRSLQFERILDTI